MNRADETKTKNRSLFNVVCNHLGLEFLGWSLIPPEIVAIEKTSNKYKYLNIGEFYTAYKCNSLFLRVTFLFRLKKKFSLKTYAIIYKK